MQNVYDAIDDFYTHDPNWNELLPRETVENYFRQRAWQGAHDFQLQKEWKVLVMLCIYLENADLTLDELTGDELVDAVSWCGQNVVDFILSYTSIQSVLDTLGSFFVYLKKQKKLTSSVAPYLAKEMLLKDDGTVALLDSDGRYLPGEEEREENAAPPAEGKVFLNAQEELLGLMSEIHLFFQKDQFNADFERAVALYEGALGHIDINDEAGEEFWRGFWDYFLFDYHLIQEDVPALTYFKEHGNTAYLELCNELNMAFTSVFYIEDVIQEERYLVRDFLTGEPYYAGFHVDNWDGPLEEQLFMGHIFVNRSMGMNFLEPFHIPPLAQKRFMELLSDCLDWFDVQQPGADWDDFLNRHSLLCRKLLHLVEKNPAGVRFPYETQQLDYRPPQLGKDPSYIERLIENIFFSSHLSVYDVTLARNLWQDFLNTDPHVVQLLPQVWAAAVVENYLEINEKRTARNLPFFKDTMGISPIDLEHAYQDIRDALQLGPSDPRYLNEQGFLMLFANETQK